LILLRREDPSDVTPSLSLGCFVVVGTTTLAEMTFPPLYVVSTKDTFPGAFPLAVTR
jgi:hypothetical protein